MKTKLLLATATLAAGGVVAAVVVWASTDDPATVVAASPDPAGATTTIDPPDAPTTTAPADLTSTTTAPPEPTATTAPPDPAGDGDAGTEADHHLDAPEAMADHDMGSMDDVEGMDDMASMDGIEHKEHEHALPPLAEREAAATPEQRAAADQLLADTRAAMARYQDVDDALADGFAPEPGKDDVEGATSIHFRNRRNRQDVGTLDPTHAEGLVYHRDAAGEYHLLGAVFTVFRGEEAPTPGGPIFQWHTHDERCDQFYVAPGACRDTFRMMHLWTPSNLVVRDPWTNPFRAAIDWAASGVVRPGRR